VIQSAGITTNVLTFGGFLRQLAVDGRRPSRRPPDVTMVSISPGYFDTLGVKLSAESRTPTARPARGGHRQPAIRRRCTSPARSLGRRICLTDSSPQIQPRPVDATIAGSLRPHASATCVIPIRTRWSTFRIARGSAAVHVVIVRVPAIPRASRRSCAKDARLSGHPAIPFSDGSDAGAAALAAPTFGSMFALFAVIALVLSAVGLYAVTAYR
jgi:hypothetical protein